VDVFIDTTDSPEQIGERLGRLAAGTPYELKMVSNRGTVVWPSTGGSTNCVDHFRCRFQIVDEARWDARTSVPDLLNRIGTDYRWMHVEKLEEIDGVPGFTRAQGEN
jgi:isocitrate dehydrogenase